MHSTFYQRLVIVCSALLIASPVSRAQDASTESAVKLAGLYLKLGQDDQCRSTLEGVLKMEPGNVEALIVLARLELKQNHADAALKAANTVLARAPENADATVAKARALAQKGDRAAGIKLIARLPAAEKERFEDDLDASGLTGDQTKAALPATKEDLLDNKLESARAAIAKKDWKTADRLTAGALKDAPENEDAMALRADYLSEAGRAAEAVKLLKKLKASHKATDGPFDEELSLAYALQDAGQLDEAARSFEAVAGGKEYPDSDRAQAREALVELKNAKALEEGDAAMDAGDATKAMQIAGTVLASQPDNEDALILKARAQAVTGHAHEAVQVLGAMKAKAGADKHFDAQLDYASALAADHRYQDSVTAYKEVVRKAGIYTPEERSNAAEQLDDIRENHIAGADLQLLYGSFEEGKLWRSDARFYSDRYGRTRFSAGVEWDHVQLEDQIYPRSLTKDRTSTTVTTDTMWDDHWRTFFHVGGYENGVLAGATLDYTTSAGSMLGISLDYNDPAKDTLLLAALNGRQHSITANAEIPLGEHFVFESMVIGRLIEAEGTNVGHAFGTETQLRWHPFSKKDAFYFAYVLELKDFSPDDSAFDRKCLSFFGRGSPFTPSATDAVPDHIHRHALQAHGSLHVLPTLTASVLGEVAWRQETQKIEYGAVGELLWRVSNKASVDARLEYYSGGSGPNTGEDVIMGTIGTKFNW